MARLPTTAATIYLLTLLTTLTSALVLHSVRPKPSDRSSPGSPAPVNIHISNLAPFNGFTPPTAILTEKMRLQILNTTTPTTDTFSADAVTVAVAVAMAAASLTATPIHHELSPTAPSPPAKSTPPPIDLFTDRPLSEVLAEDHPEADNGDMWDDAIALGLPAVFVPIAYGLFCFCFLSMFLLGLMWVFGWLDCSLNPTRKFLWGYRLRRHRGIIDFNTATATADREPGFTSYYDRYGNFVGIGPIETRAARRAREWGSEERFRSIDDGLRRLGL